MPPRHARISVAAAFVAQGLMFSLLLTHLPQFKERYGASDGTVTLVVLMVTILAGVGSLLAEQVAVATSSRAALRIGLLVVAAAGAVIATAPGMAAFAVGFAIYGLGVGAVDAGGNMQAVAVQERYGRSIITSFHAAWSAAAIAGALYVSAGERISLSLTASILPGAGVVLVILLVAGPGLLRTSEQHPDDETPAGLTSSDRIRQLRTPLMLLGLAMTAYWAVDAGISNWSSIFLHDLLDASDSTAALGYALYQATALVSRLGGDLAVRRMGAVTTVRIGSAIGTVGALIVVVAPNPLVAIAGFGVTGLGLPVVAPLCFSSAGALVSTPADLDRVVARLNVFNYLGSLLGAVVLGVVATGLDLRAGFVVPVVLAIAAFALAPSFRPPASDRRPSPAPAGETPG
jgi:MFS family permease